jgi:hypothetical protein
MSTKPIYIDVRAAKIQDRVSEGDTWEQIPGVWGQAFPTWSGR